MNFLSQLFKKVLYRGRPFRRPSPIFRVLVSSLVKLRQLAAKESLEKRHHSRTGARVSILGLSWVCLGLSWALLGLSWALLGLSWAVLGLSWGCLGPVLGTSWAVLKKCTSPIRKSMFFENHCFPYVKRCFVKMIQKSAPFPYENSFRFETHRFT